MLGDKRAFTMLEMIVVLLIVSVIVFGTTISIKNLNENNILNQTIKLIGSKYNTAQSIALVNNHECYVDFKESKVELICNEKVISLDELDKNIIISSNFIDDKIKINKKGNISRAGTIVLKSKAKTKNMVFSIGKGNYVVK